MIVKLGLDMRDFTKGIRKASASVKAFGGRLKNIGKSLSVGVTAPLVAFSAVAVKTFLTQEKAEQKLRGAIIATGKASEISASALFDYASELQQVTTFGDEATISGLAMLQSLADLDEKGLKKITPGVQDFAAAMGVDLQTAFNLVGKTLGSSTNALARYGVEIDATGTKEQKLEQLTAALTSKFGGMARTLAQTKGGALQQFSNSLGDLFEQFGDIIAEAILPFVAKMKNLVKWFASLDAATKKTMVIFAGFSAVIGPVVAGLGFIVTGIGLALPALATLGTAFVTIGVPILAGVALFAVLWKGIQMVIDIVSILAIKLGSFGSKVIKKMGVWLIPLLKNFKELGKTLITIAKVASGSSWEEAQNAAWAFGGTINRMIDQVKADIKNGTNTTGDDFKKFFEKAGDDGLAWSKAMDDTVKNTMDNISTQINNAENILKGGFKFEIPKPDKDTFEGGKGGGGKGQGESSGMGEMFSGMFAGLGEKLEGAKTLFSDFWAGMKEAQTVHTAGVISGWESIVGSFNSVSGQLMEMAGQLWGAFSAGFSEAITEVIFAGASFFEAMKNLMKNLARMIIQMLIQILLKALIVKAVLMGLGISGAALPKAGSFGAALIGGFTGLAEGGIASSPMIAEIGEKGREAVIPLDRLDEEMGGANKDQTIIVEMDGRALTRTVVKNMPSVVRVNTGVRI